MTKRCMFLKFSVAMLMLVGWNGAAGQERIQVLVGQQRRILVPTDCQRINIGDPTIATATDVPGETQIIITGRSKGVTSLIMELSGGNVMEKSIEVIQRDPNAILREIKTVFDSIEGISFLIVENTIFAKGVTYTQADSKKLGQILKLYPEIVNLVDEQAEKRMVSININIIEVNKTGKADYNNTESTVSNLIFENNSGSTKPFLKPEWSWNIDIDRLIDRVAYWVTSGQGKIVANPTISVTEGDTASFVSGGEIPFEYQTRDGMAIEWKPYGIIVKIKPTILSSGSVMLYLESEVSTIDLTFQLKTGLPAIASRKAKSVNIINMGQTVVLAGIYQTSIMKSNRRVPVLGYILPFLFSSVNDIEETKEIMVLVTPNAPPKMKKSDYPMIEEIKKDIKNY